MQNHYPSERKVKTLTSTVLVIAILFAFASLLGSAQQSTAAATPSNASVSQSNTPREVTSGAAQLIGPYNPSGKLRLAIGLIPPHMAAEEDFLKQLQDQSSPNFHKYLTPEEWNARFAPSETDEQAVVDWATQQGLTITGRYPNRLMVNVEGTVDTIQKAFRTTINSYQVNGATEFSNRQDPVIPANLSTIIGSVDGLNSIQRMRPASGQLKGIRGPDYSAGPLRQDGPSLHADAIKSSTNAATPDAGGGQVGGQITNGFYDPADIWNSNAYDYNALQNLGHCCNPAHVATGSPVESSIAVAVDGDILNSDIAGFQAQYPYLAYYFHRVWVGGTPYCCSDEATLDTEWTIATANSRGSYLDTAQVWVYESASGFGGFGTVYQQMLTDNKVRAVNISYGLAEFSGVSNSVMNSWHNTFNQMIGQGWTIMAASGDGGASAGCGSSLAVLYPESDPDLVSVGGSQLGLYSNGTFASEVAWTGDTWSGACSHNDGGSGGGCSAKWSSPGYQNAPFQSGPYCGSGSRSVPDVALNASSHSGQNYYFNGSLQGVAGTSIASPMMTGFIAQANAYLLAIGLGGAPLGEVDYKIYWLGTHTGSSYEAHYPFYDITSGCNSNDDTNYWGIGYYCAGSGYDLVTGWGSFNALQLAWGFNTYDLGDFGAPKITFSGPSVSTSSDTWYNTDQTVSWTIADTGGGYTPTGVSGYSAAWDTAFSDPTSEPHPGSGNSFYSGPEYPNATSGSMLLSSAGQGCHYATVDAWDNSGITSGNQYFYWICYDTVAPTISIANSPAPNGFGWNKASVAVTLTAADPGGSGASGIKKTFYAIDKVTCFPGSLGTCSVYTGPFTISAPGQHYVYYFTEDNAGNYSSEPYEWVNIDETAPVTTATLSGTLHGSVYGTAVGVTLSHTDNLSGVQSTHYQIDGGAFTTYSAPFSVTALGAHTVKYYSVDYAGNTEATKSVSFTIWATTTTTLTSSLNPSVNGKAVTLTANVTASPSGTATGTVTFKNGSTSLGTATLSGGVAKLTTTTLPVGGDSLTASYGGVSLYFPSVSSTLSEVVNESTTTSVASSVNPAVYGQTVVFTAKVTPSISGTPTGSVEFLDGTTSLGTAALAGGSATFSTHTLAAGAHSISVDYLGSSTYAASTSAKLTETINKAATTAVVTSSVNPSAFNQSVTFTATVTSTAGVPTGTVTLVVDGVNHSTGSLSSGKVAFAIANLSVGTHKISATYAGASDFAVSASGNVSQVVDAAKTTTTLASSLNPSTHGTTVTFTATVKSLTSGTPAGTVTFTNGGTTIGTGTLSGGKATFSTSALAVGTHSITATYGATTDFSSSTSAALSQVVH